MLSNKQILSLAISVIAVAVLVMGCGQQQAETEKQKEIARLVTDEAWNKGITDVLDEHYSADYVYHIPPFPDVVGIEAYKKRIADYRSTYPDLHLTIDELIILNNKSVIRWTMQGTHTGRSDTYPYPPTGKRVSMTGCTVSHRVNGKVVEEWNHGNILGFIQQLGHKVSPPLTETTFARVTVTQMKPEKIDEARKLYKESVVPDAKAQKGYRGVFLLSDYTTGKGYSIAIWDSEEDAIANEQSGYYKAQVDKFKDIFSAKPIREGYVVTVQE
ncbi:MAG: SnoaL-like domain-containing protein [Candidatus Latescibacteria bacterium]|jgi:steroid delta-isomerase-like uncharacterized protein|nr:SnoaL-like domain-containing protein [Candidatus Latescibacterota bacterium]